ncbi:hypothetical protein FQR65_LT09414 [Abscondita terminalis]|nr:hypothetical protein FQR65_LT09414 [Abscondita terminalis]
MLLNVMIFKNKKHMFILLFYIYNKIYTLPIFEQNSTVLQFLTTKPNLTVFLTKTPIRFSFGNQPTVSKFPPVLEFILQKIQTQFSNYVYEDLSRPATWDKPVYTVNKPIAEELIVSENITTNVTDNINVTVIINESITEKPDDLDDNPDPDKIEHELLFEKIPNNTQNMNNSIQPSEQHFNVILIYVIDERKEIK